MKIPAIAVLFTLLACGQSFATIVVDDFNSSSLPLDITDSTAGWGFETSSIDSAPGTLFDQRYAYVYLDSGLGSVRAQIASGVARVTTTADATGRFYLYHDNVFDAPDLDITGELAGGGGITIVFAAPVSGSPVVYLALKSRMGQVSGNFPIADGLLEFHVPFSEFFEIETLDPSRVYESRVFFTEIDPGTQLDIDSIIIVPEPSTSSMLLLSSFAFSLRRRQSRAAKLP